MPELPEVETVRRGLAPVLEGQRLSRVEARRADLRFPFPEGFVQRLTGATIQRLERRAKYLMGVLDRGETLVMHLGMSGRFEIARPEGTIRPGEFVYASDPDPKHAHVVFDTQAGGRVTYYDPRRFGYMALIETAKLGEHPWFAGLGPEPLGPDFNTEGLKAAFAGRKQGPKTLLLDQRVVAGLGNIYVCEALNRAQISPFKPAGAIPARKLPGLVTIGCNIHDWMISHVVIVPTPWFAKTDAQGQVGLSAPAGRYRVEIWHPRMGKQETRDVTLVEGTPAHESFSVVLKPDRRIRRSLGGKSGGYR